MCALTVEQLKEKLGEFNLSRVGNKAELQKRLLEHFNVEKVTSDGDDDESVYSVANSVQSVVQSVSHFTLKDIEDSVSNFTGEGLPEVKNWINEFEDCASTVGWNNIQKFIFAKQLLEGAGRIFIRSQPNVKSWNNLKDVLNFEFYELCCYCYK